MASTAQNNDMTTRSENRVQCPFVGQLRRGAGMMQPVTIRDMSSGGLQATCFNAPSEGERVTVRFDNGRSVHGLVRWVRKGVFGVEFQAPVNVSMVTENAKTHPLRRSTDIR
ncbi:PilZ domain-containing protein [Parasphingorhabdus halotolerans]|uniref:PilZ domain-containing protein n=1 Tax=Parasphingorhabdus halotolerans TaxID=2725558 RepID=A0A6H2DPS6_9SPHN|nr:PilZ domain-containing protein [Parasphingorhabdus halotolerans]QJB69983.1 PilZ domain-containing protein [Parasphingorhabdus halotolerans]